MTSKWLCVRLLSGDVVYEGGAPRSLTQLRDEVAGTLFLECDELSFCSGDAVLICIEEAGEQITVVRDKVMGSLNKLSRYSFIPNLPEHLWSARGHRRLLLPAELGVDQDVILAAETPPRVSRKSPRYRRESVFQVSTLVFSAPVPEAFSTQTAR